MELIFYSATDVGLIRENNQDSILVDGENQLFIVADGMGGHQGGEVASRLAVQSIQEVLADRKTEKESFLLTDIKEACLKANEIIHKEGKNNINLRGMGTTLSLFLIGKDGHSYIANIGDSRIYMEKNNNMWLLTEDHNLLTSQKKACFFAGDPMPEPSSEGNTLVRSVGFFPTVEPDIFEKTVEKGEKYLMCSDGLSGFIPHEEIHEVLKTYPLQDIPGECVKRALDVGGDDNISVIVIEVQ